MGKNRVQKKNKAKEKGKSKHDYIYSQKHIRIALMKQEKHLQKLSGKR
tara:strand:- start:194 stop:337 length:144 start_codon:yes stop_codon:yes gene_type:complete